MEESTAAPTRRLFTPAVVASTVFVAACAVFAIAFVGARGGLQLPVAATQPPVANASEQPTVAPTAAATTPSTPVPSDPAMSAPPTPPSPAPTAIPTATSSPTPPPTAPPATPPVATPYVPPTLEPGDPLLALDPCPGLPGCFEYVVARGDTLSGIISRYLLDIDVLQALNPGGLDDPNLVVVGQRLLLGRDPLAALQPCPDGTACVLYEVQPGDSLAEIADLYLLAVEAIRAANPGLVTPIQAGEVLRLPRGGTG